MSALEHYYSKTPSIEATFEAWGVVDCNYKFAGLACRQPELLEY